MAVLMVLSCTGGRVTPLPWQPSCRDDRTHQPVPGTVL